MAYEIENRSPPAEEQAEEGKEVLIVFLHFARETFKKFSHATQLLQRIIGDSTFKIWGYTKN